jgi:hypothetical protein
MQMIKQRPSGDGTIAMDCGVCVIAMLTDQSYEQVLVDMPNYQEASNEHWMRYLALLGFQVDQVADNAPPTGHRLYCAIFGHRDGVEIRHAIAVDEDGRIFDPSIDVAHSRFPSFNPSAIDGSTNRTHPIRRRRNHRILVVPSGVCPLRF